MADLSVQALARVFVGAAVPRFDNDGVARVMVGLRMNGERLPLRPEPGEQVAHDGIRSDPGFPTGHVRISLRLPPFDGRVHGADDGRHVPTCEGRVQILHDVHVAHAVLQSPSASHRLDTPQGPARILVRTKHGGQRVCWNGSQLHGKRGRQRHNQAGGEPEEGRRSSPGPDDGVGFDLHEHVGIDEALHFDHRRGGTDVAEHFAVRTSDGLPVGRDVDDVHPRPHDIVEAGAGLDQHRPDVPQRVHGLRVRVSAPDEDAALVGGGRAGHPHLVVDPDGA